MSSLKRQLVRNAYKIEMKGNEKLSEIKARDVFFLLFFYSTLLFFSSLLFHLLMVVILWSGNAGLIYRRIRLRQEQENFIHNL